jgi:hypothetical protein
MLNLSPPLPPITALERDILLPSAPKTAGRNVFELSFSGTHRCGFYSKPNAVHINDTKQLLSFDLFDTSEDYKLCKTNGNGIIRSVCTEVLTTRIPLNVRRRGKSLSNIRRQQTSCLYDQMLLSSCWYKHTGYGLAELYWIHQ